MAIEKVKQGDYITAAQTNELIGAVNAQSRVEDDGETVWFNGSRIQYPYADSEEDLPEAY